RYRHGAGGTPGATRSGGSGGACSEPEEHPPRVRLGLARGSDWAPLSHRGRCSYRKPAHGGRRCLSGLVGEWEVNLDGEAAEGAFLELEVAVVYLDQVADDIQPEAVPGNSLIQADPALQYSLPI